jgi:hypothetical protein
LTKYMIVDQTQSDADLKNRALLKNP